MRPRYPITAATILLLWLAALQLISGGLLPIAQATTTVLAQDWSHDSLFSINEDSPAVACVAGTNFSVSGFEPCQSCLDCGDKGGDRWGCLADSNSVCRESSICAPGTWSTTGWAPCTTCRLCGYLGVQKECSLVQDTVCVTPAPTPAPPVVEPTPTPAPTEAPICDCKHLWPKYFGTGRLALRQVQVICDQEHIVSHVPGVLETCCGLAAQIGGDPCIISYFYHYAAYELQKFTFLRGLCGIETAPPCAFTCNNSLHEGTNSALPGGYEDGADCVNADKHELYPDCAICDPEPACDDLTLNGDEDIVDFGGSCGISITPPPPPTLAPTPEPPTPGPSTPAPTTPKPTMPSDLDDRNYLRSESQSTSSQELALGLVGLLLLVCVVGILGLWAYRRHVIKRALDAELKELQGADDSQLGLSATSITGMNSGGRSWLQGAEGGSRSGRPDRRRGGGGDGSSGNGGPQGLPSSWSHDGGEGEEEDLEEPEDSAISGGEEHSDIISLDVGTEGGATRARMDPPEPQQQQQQQQAGPSPVSNVRALNTPKLAQVPSGLAVVAPVPSPTNDAAAAAAVANAHPVSPRQKPQPPAQPMEQHLDEHGLPLPPHWSMHKTEDGQHYYWNSLTSASLWVRPQA